MDLKEAIYNRRAVRNFTTETVSETSFGSLSTLPSRPPARSTSNPGHFPSFATGILLARISREAKAYMLRTSPAALASPHFQELLGNPEFDIFYHAPVLIVISAQAESPWVVEDCALAAENMMLTACAAGLGTCWIGFAQVVAWNAGGKGDAQTARWQQAGCTHYRGTPQIAGSSRAEKRAENKLGCLSLLGPRSQRRTSRVARFTQSWPTSWPGSASELPRLPDR